MQPKRRFRPPLPRGATVRRVHRPVDENDPARRELCRVVSLRDHDPVGFDRACNQFVLDNLGLAKDFAADYDAKHVPLADLEQAAAIGLLKAIRRFDVTKAGKFSTYAVWWMKHECGALLKAEQLVSPPSSLQKAKRALDWAERHGRNVSDVDVAERAKVKPHHVAEARGAYFGNCHKQVDHRRMAAGRDVAAPAEDVSALHRALFSLPPLQRAVLADEFGTAAPAGVTVPTDEMILAHIRRLALRRLRLALHT